MTGEPQQPTPEEIAANLERNVRNLRDVAQNGLNPQTIAGFLPDGIMNIAASFMGDEFISEQLEANFPAIKAAIMERITDPEIPADENVFIAALGDMTGEEITEILQSSPQLQAMLLETVVQTGNSGSILETAGISTEGIPQEILEMPITEITSEHLDSIDPAILRSLAMQLPINSEAEGGINAVFDNMNNALTQRGLEVIEFTSGEVSIEDRETAFNNAIDQITQYEIDNYEPEEGGNILSRVFNWAAENLASDDQIREIARGRVMDEIHSNIAEQAPAAIQALSAAAASNFNIEDMEPAEVQALVRENTDVIHEMLVNPANRDAIGNIITLDLIRDNMDNPAIAGMAMEMAADQSQGMIAGLIGNILQSFPGLQQLFDMFNSMLSGFIGPIMENMGFDNDDEAPAVAAAPDATQPPPAAEQEREVAAAALPAGPQ